MIETVEALRAAAGQELGVSDWHPIEQAAVDGFADATGDQQWIHVDRARAAQGPFGGTIAHGFFTLSLFPLLLQELVQVRASGMGINYGCNRVRFPAPVPVGARVRLRVQVAAVEDLPEGAVQTVFRGTFEIEGRSKPGCVADVVFRYYPPPPLLP